MDTCIVEEKGRKRCRHGVPFPRVFPGRKLGNARCVISTRDSSRAASTVSSEQGAQRRTHVGQRRQRGDRRTLRAHLCPHLPRCVLAVVESNPDEAKTDSDGGGGRPIRGAARAVTVGDDVDRQTLLGALPSRSASLATDHLPTKRVGKSARYTI